MSLWELSTQDLKQLEEHGISVSQLEEQIELFSGPPPSCVLERPCTPGDGITVLTDEEQRSFLDLFEREGPSVISSKFIPASGAATRMFKSLMSRPIEKMTRDQLSRDAALGDKDAGEVLTFIDNIKEFAFFSELDSSLRSVGYDAEALLAEGHYGVILDRLLSPAGMGYAGLPKGLLSFHLYAGGARTAFEEHLVETAQYLLQSRGKCRLAVTVSPEHLDRFKSFWQKVRSLYEAMLGVKFEVGFSLQSPSTDTIAVTIDNKPFRTEDGRLLFRPAGHGALLENLNSLDCDLAFITNIDNVVPDRLKGEVVRWKKILGGMLLHLRKRVFDYLAVLPSAKMDESVVDAAQRFAVEVLNLPRGRVGDLYGEERIKKLLFLMDRPIRVCGMVKNKGEVGGGPFWVRDGLGDTWPQIVEKAQVDMSSPGQKEAFEASTHFNPVDIVCWLRDMNGTRFDLPRFRDPKAVFISRKSYRGTELKALELPGLWNGGMAWWTTVFVEVPSETFNPVKTVNDLLRPPHRA